MQYSSDSPGGRRSGGVNPTAPPFVSLFSTLGVSSTSIDRAVASGSSNNQVYVSTNVRRAVTPTPSSQDNAPSRERPRVIPSSLPPVMATTPYTPLRAPESTEKNAKTSRFSAPMSMMVKTPSPGYGKLPTSCPFRVHEGL